MSADLNELHHEMLRALLETGGDRTPRPLGKACGVSGQYKRGDRIVSNNPRVHEDARGFNVDMGRGPSAFIREHYGWWRITGIGMGYGGLVLDDSGERARLFKTAEDAVTYVLRMR